MLYDARLGGGFPYKPTVIGCQDESCQPPEQQPPFNAPATSTFTGSGNRASPATAADTPLKPKPLTRREKLARAIKSCRKRYAHSKRARVSCEKQAREKYAAHTSNNRKPSKSRRAK
jgi:hypothetical protein